MTVTRLVCLGDSITWGFPYGNSYSWVAISAEVLGIPMINRGINGDTARDLLYRFERDVLAENPSHVFIMVGTNDAAINISLNSFQDKVLQMHAKSVAHGITPLLGLPIPSADRWLEYRLEKFRLWLTEFASANKIAFLDFSPGMLLDNRVINHNCYTDDVHPSKKGYRAMAGIFVEFYRNCLS